jgi:hypothetical protein
MDFRTGTIEAKSKFTYDDIKRIVDAGLKVLAIYGDAPEFDAVTASGDSNIFDSVRKWDSVKKIQWVDDCFSLANVH